MRISLHGYGKMGKAVEQIAQETGHEIADMADADVLIDFSHAAAIDRVLDLATLHGLDLVIGTTGWNARLEEVRARIANADIGCVYASNFSPGANVAFALARRAGELFARFPQYDVGMQERHHVNKKDAPSGTALRMAAEVREGSGGKLDPTIAASRVGAEIGFHTLFFDSPDDLVEISHQARGREGFARGAVLAAEMVRGRKGLLRFDELLG